MVTTAQREKLAIFFTRMARPQVSTNVLVILCAGAGQVDVFLLLVLIPRLINIFGCREYR